MPPKDKYTDPTLRDEVKHEVQQSDKGGAPGQWSARKAQFMASEYKKRGGDYNTEKSTGQDPSQRNLSKWTEEEWQTADGSGKAKHEDGTESRYLPKKAWEELSDGEKKKTEEKKVKESKGGKQFVGNTGAAKGKRKEVSKGRGVRIDEDEDGDAAEEGEENEPEEEEEEDDKGKAGEDSEPKGRGTGRAAKNAVKDKVKANMAELHDQDDSDEESEPDGAEEDGPADDEDFDEDDAAAADASGEDYVDEDDEENVDENDTAESLMNDDGQVDEDAEMEAEDAEAPADEDEAAHDDKVTDEKQSKADEEAKHPAGSGAKKRGRKAKAPEGDEDQEEQTPAKKQKSNADQGSKPKTSQKGSKNTDGTYGSKHDPAEPPAPAGSASRLPKVGQSVTWKALPGFVKGKVVEIVREDKEVRGKRVKGSKNDPRIVLEAESGKIAGHKPDSCFFE